MLKLIPDVTHIDFMKCHKLSIGISVASMIGTIILLLTIGLNFGTDFAGGILMEVQTPKAENVAQLRDDLNKLELGNVSLQEFGEKGRVLIRLPQQKGDDGQQKAVDAVKANLGKGANYRRVEFVGPQVGKELVNKGIMAVIFSTLGILAYVMMRFQWQFGLGAVFALLHDTVLTIGLICLTGVEFDLTMLAAVLMIGGYSINDTVVVFDRVREMMQKYRKMPLPELFNLSINATLSRTILTGGTSILALVALWVLGGPVIQGFVIALIWGIVVGTYSSVFVATPLLMYMGLKQPGTKASE
jgi:preprotein translocase subunit SecF